MERKNSVTFQGSPLTLIGKEIKVGDKAPDFKVLTRDLKEANLSSYKGKIKLLASVPSLDTPVCDLEIKQFNESASRISKDAVILFVSADLPFAQQRFCQAFGINQVEVLSDHRDFSFAEAYGVHIKELRLLTRAVFIVDKSGLVKYVEYVKEITGHPNYEAALTALKNV